MSNRVHEMISVLKGVNYEKGNCFDAGFLIFSFFLWSQ